MPRGSCCSSRARCPVRAAATWSCGLRSRFPGLWCRPPKLRPPKPRRSLPSPPRRHRSLTRRRTELRRAMELKMVNDKMYRAGLCSILSQLAREDRIRVVDEFRVEQPKTKLLAQKVKSMGFDGVLVITDEIDQNLLRSSRNLPNVEVIAVRHGNPVALVRFPSVLLTKAALAKLEEMLK